MSKSVHNKYHEDSKKQNRIIGNKNFTYYYLRKYLDKALKLKDTKTILDIGCGAGTLALYLAAKGYYVTGIDISQKAIKICNESARSLEIKDISFQVKDFPKEVPEKKFDLIVFSEVIEHIKKDTIAIKEISSLLNPNGLLFLTTPSANAPLHKLGMTHDFDKRVGHVRRYKQNELLNLLIENQFAILEIYKTESVIRNFLFINPLAGRFVRFIKFFLVDIFFVVDYLFIKILGESQFIIIAQKK